MPELPDVAGFRDYLERVAKGRRIKRTEIPTPRILRGATAKKFDAAVRGRRIVAGRRHGKLLFARLDNDAAIAMHFGMTGELSDAPAGGERPKYARVILLLDNGHELAYLNRRMLGWVGVTDDIDATLADEGLGPDALDEQFDPASFRQRLRNRRTSIKALLMDQQTIAGIGNVWGDEILFHAGLDPRRPVSDLSDDEVRNLHRVMRRVLKTGARHGGDATRLPKGYLLPHRDNDGECPRCGGPLEKIKVAGRPTHFCPRCQK